MRPSGIVRPDGAGGGSANPDAAYAAGIHLVRDVVAAGVVDLAGTVRGRAERRLGLDASPDAALRSMSSAMAEAIDAAGVPRERLLGAGIGVPGPLDLRRGSLLDIVTPRSWSHFAMRDAVADALGMRVIMDNDATAAAIGERWRGVGAGRDSLIYVYLGSGVGAGLILGGQAYRGTRGNAGEISHIQADPNGAPLRLRKPRVSRPLREPRRVAARGPPRRPRGAPDA